MNRRTFLRAAGGSLLAARLATPAWGAETVDINLVMKDLGAFVGFDPIGLYLRTGQTVRWRCESGVHTSTAYHPANANHALRIPETAEPWDSGWLQPGDTFTYRFSVPGVYDYFCKPHEAAGMVGRIVVDHPAGPGTKPFGYFLDNPKAANWQAVPEAARQAFPSVAAIMARHVIPLSGPA